jgi:hypothetical protein
MKPNLFFTTCALAAMFAGSHARAFSAGDLIVSVSGDGTSALSSSGNALTLQEFTTSGTAVGSLINTGVLVSGTATSEGAVTISPDGTTLTVAGYSTASTGTGSLSSRTDTLAPRQFNTINVASGTAGTPVAVGTFSGNNIRGAVTSGSNTWLVGGTNGTVLYNGSLPVTTIQSTSANNRVVSVQNGNLYYSTGSGTAGIYSLGNSPTTATAPTAVLTGVAGQGSSPYDYAFSPDGKTLYVADSTAGVQKFTLSGSTWSLAYNITSTTTGITGVAVDFSGTNAVVYAVNPTNLYSFTDLGAGGAFSSIATAGTNTAFRGLEITPQAVPEPATYGIVLLGAGILLIRRRHLLS